MKKNNNGFTIIEMLVVIALIAILVVLVLVNFNKSKEQTRDKIRISNIQSLRLALEEYRSVCGQYPEDIYGSDAKKSNGCPSGVSFDDFIAEIPVDPSTGDDYLYKGLRNLPGLSTTDPNHCYDYHIGAELEAPATSPYFSSDHDYKKSQKCGGVPANDFDGDNDTKDGIYDFRSTNAQ